MVHPYRGIPFNSKKGKDDCYSNNLDAVEAVMLMEEGQLHKVTYGMISCTHLSWSVPGIREWWGQGSLHRCVKGCLAGDRTVLYLDL